MALLNTTPSSGAAHPLQPFDLLFQFVTAFSLRFNDQNYAIDSRAQHPPTALKQESVDNRQ